MILGIGNDIIDIRRIEKTLETYGERFIERIYTEIEQERSDKKHQRAASYAKRFAAKEACAKALGTGIAKGVKWRDMGVINSIDGAPTMILTGAAEIRLNTMVPTGHKPVIHLTITDDFPMAQAFVIISAQIMV